VLSELEKFFGNRREARQCLYDAVRAGLVRVEGNVVCYDECIHKRRLVKGLGVLSYTLDELEIVLAENLYPIQVCDKFKQFLSNKYDINLEEAAKLMKIALEHLITSGRLKYKISIIKRMPVASVVDMPALVRIAKDFTITIEDVRELRSSITMVREEVEDWKKNIGGCCEECVNMGLCEKAFASMVAEYLEKIKEAKEIIERVVDLLISRICIWKLTSYVIKS
jgi:hypothetical protein